ncbi:MAG: enoyl-CoA hydratase/isomerase family protein [Pseudomonadota bacterium]
MSIVTCEIADKIATITLNNGENQQDLDFAKAMLAALDQAEADKSVRAIVITSPHEKSWSTGVKLSWLMAQMNAGTHDNVKEFMLTMNAVFYRLLTIPIPTIAAITGHAFGNGAMLACACDFRFMRADRGYLCFPEVDVSIPLLPGMIAFVEKKVPRHILTEIVLTGRRLTAAELAEAKIISAACPTAEETYKTAIEFAATMKKARGIYGELKRRFHSDVHEVQEAQDRPLIEAMKLMA